MDKAVRDVVDKQKAAGIDIGNDGEQQRVGFQTYVPARMAGFGGVSKRRRGREFEEFPELIELSDAPLPAVQPAAERAARPGRGQVSRHRRPIQHEIARFKAWRGAAARSPRCS